MLLKGCKKNLIVLKGIGSDYIEEAYLILKPEMPHGTARGDIIDEANRLIHEYETGRRKKRKPFSFASFCIGVLLSAAVAMALFLLL